MSVPSPLDDLLVRPIIDMALAEDLGRAGDITGQACISLTRILVTESRHDAMVDALAGNA